MYTMHKNNAIDSTGLQYPLYDGRWEHDACGTGFLAQVSGQPSHFIVQTALDALARLTHRGAQDADAETSDGAGILTQIPKTLLCEELALQHISISDPADLAVGMLFLPSQERSAASHTTARQLIEQSLAEAGLSLLTWRNPPVDYAVLGSKARMIAPDIAQVLLARPATLSPEEFERSLYYARRLCELRLREAHIEGCYIVSLSSSTLIYKGLLAPNELARFYLDLADPRYTSAIAVFHQRYSTNTFPAWPLAQPMRLLAHNGEINTIQGNQNWMQAREQSLSSPLWGEKIETLLPVLTPEASDSARLDMALELLAVSGRDLLHSIQMMIPPAWEQDAAVSEAERAWCEYHAGILEPWDGPAALVFTDGRTVGAALDRNGLRPARYTLTRDGLLMVASETGVLRCDPHDIIELGRLGPGEMIAVDVERNVILRDQEIKSALASRQPYQEWVGQHMSYLSKLAENAEPVHKLLDAESLFARQQLFGYTHEDVEMVLRPILAEHKEPTWSMGDDAPIAPLSRQVRSFSDYFRQRFAQVTNPPIDPLREKVVMSLDYYLGKRQSLLTESPEHAHLLHIQSPLLTETELSVLRSQSDPQFRAQTLHTTFSIADGPDALEQALSRLEEEAALAVQSGATLLILSDADASLQQAPIPMVIAVGAVHRSLIRRGLRPQAALLCETGTVCDVHQIALLLGYGAEAVVPTLALTSVRALAGERKLEHLTPDEAVETYLYAIEEGLRKVMARMGISTLRNIVGAGQFEIIGLAPDLAERCFAGSALFPGKVTLTQIAEQTITYCQNLLQQDGTEVNTKRRKLNDLGRFRFRRDAEYHAFNPLIVRALQKASQSGAVEDYKQYTSMVYHRPPTALRDLLKFKGATPIPLDQVESMESIRARFVISAMSVGALNPETHRTIAAAMNSIGSRNNTGEGGEDPD
ncbi:MAG TPA: glutamate synthase central domain-containing protein, partial [Ktedonobacteraceae bacterium]